MSASAPLVGVIMGSDSDLEVMQGALDVLTEFGVPHEVRIVSAHRTPDVMVEYARSAADRRVGRKRGRGRRAKSGAGAGGQRYRRRCGRAAGGNSTDAGRR